MQDHLEVYVQYSCKQPVSIAAADEDVAAAVHRRRVAVPAQGPWRHEPLRGRRVRAQQRRRRLPEPDVPLPADRDPLRRLVAGRRARLPGAHRADVLRLARLGADHVDRPEGQAGAALQLPLDRRRTAASGSRRSASPAASSTSRRWRRSTAARSRRGRRSRPTSRSSTGCARDAETALHPSCTCRMGRADDDSGRRPADDARSTASRACASSTPRRCATSPTATSTRR